jgi:hypothetical protein
MQYRPTAAELLDAVASLLEDEVLGAVPPVLQHRIRVSGNICRILQREVELGPGLADAERERWARLLGDADADLPSLRAAVVRRLADPTPFAPEEERAVYDALLATVRDDLRISKPGYDREGGGE